MGHAPHLLAALNNTALELLSRQGETNIARARRKFAYQFDKALHAKSVKRERANLATALGTGVARFALTLGNTD